MTGWVNPFSFHSGGYSVLCSHCISITVYPHEIPPLVGNYWITLDPIISGNIYPHNTAYVCSWNLKPLFNGLVSGKNLESVVFTFKYRQFLHIFLVSTHFQRISIWVCLKIWSKSHGIQKGRIMFHGISSQDTLEAASQSDVPWWRAAQCLGKTLKATDYWGILFDIVLYHIHSYIHTLHTFIHSYVHTFIHSYMHTCIHEYMHTFIHAYSHTFIHSYMHTCIHAYMHTVIHSYMHTCIHEYMHTVIHSYIHTFIRSYMHTCIHAYMNTCIQSYIHTFIHSYVHTFIHS